LAQCELVAAGRRGCADDERALGIVTISSGIVGALPGLLKDLSSVPTLLAPKLPAASTFFLT
jgi:hypothetical protein